MLKKLENLGGSSLTDGDEVMRGGGSEMSGAVARQPGLVEGRCHAGASEFLACCCCSDSMVVSESRCNKRRGTHHE